MWKERESREKSAILGMVGKTISRAELVAFEKDGIVDANDYALQLSGDGLVLLLWGASDGESLRVFDRPWKDPFERQLTQEDMVFVARSGKWTIMAAPPSSPASLVLGRRLVEARPVRDEVGRLRGLFLRVEGGGEVLYVVSGDEGRLVTNEEAGSLGLVVDT